jgi:hypothetical protein
MKSRSIKYISAVLLLAVVIAGMTGCSILPGLVDYLGANFERDGGSPDDDSGGDHTLEYEKIADEYERIAEDLPKMDFGGYEFRILLPVEKRYAKDIYAAEENGNIINDSVYRRNKILKDRHNIIITAVFCDLRIGAEVAGRSVRAGMDEYDLFALPMDMTAELTAQGVLYDLMSVPYIDFQKPWWDSNAIRQLSAENKLYFAPHAMLTSGKDAAGVVVFNKEIIVNYALESPYDLVMNGLWTVDKMREMAKFTAMDLDGDGNMGEQDRFGLLTDDDMFYSGDWTSEWVGNTQQIFEMFITHRGLFMTVNMGDVPVLRQYDLDFGILPHPKSDEAQQHYHSPVDVSGAAVSVPVTNSSLERTGILLEDLAAESFYRVLPAYYEVALMAMFGRDEESEAMRLQF